MKLLLAIIILLPLTALAEGYQTKQDILQAYGKPFWKGEGEKQEVWYYPHNRTFIFFDKDKVVKINVVTEEKI